MFIKFMYLIYSDRSLSFLHLIKNRPVGLNVFNTCWLLKTTEDFKLTLKAPIFVIWLEPNTEQTVMDETRVAEQK